MKNIIVTICLLIATNVLGKEISIDGQKFNIEALGNKTLATQINPNLAVTESISGEHPKVSVINCRKAEKLISNLKRRIERCKDDDESVSCKYTKQRIYEYAKESLDFSDSPDSYLKVEYKLPIISNLTSKIARTLNISNKDIIIQKELSSNYEITEVSVEYLSDSLYNRVEELNLFNQMDVNTYYFNRYLKVSNRLLYCDLRSGQVKIMANINNTIINTQSVSKEIKKIGLSIHNDLLAHKVNIKDIKIIQAAKLGFVIGKGLEEHKTLTSKMNIKSVFKDMINVEHRNLEIKKYKSKEDFMEATYPDRAYKKDLSQEFNITFK